MTTIKNVYDKFCIKRFPLPTEAQLADLEKRIGVRFPEDYRQFVLKFNGGYFNEPEITPVGENCPLETLESLFGIGASHETSELGQATDILLFDDNNPPKIVPIGDTGMGGLIILDTAPGEGQGAIYLKKPSATSTTWSTASKPSSPSSKNPPGPKGVYPHRSITSERRPSCLSAWELRPTPPAPTPRAPGSDSPPRRSIPGRSRKSIDQN